MIENLINSYIDNGTGSVLLYYDGVSTGLLNGSGALLNVSPSSTVGSYTGVIGGSINNFFLNEVSGFDISHSSAKFGPFANNLVNTGNFNTELTFLFSFENKQNKAGIIFGSLVRDQYLNGNPWGRGFNIGINSRNQLFFQGINEANGEYVLTADEIELANKNICSVTVSPYNVTVSKYNLADDYSESQSLFPNGQIQNSEQPYYLGASNTFYRGFHSFSGYIDKFMIISGSYPSSDLKAISSGFIGSGITSSGQSYLDSSITGYNIEIIYNSGVTGFEPFITGYQKTYSSSSLVEFVLVENVTPFSRKDGERFFTGYSLPSSFGDYLEETSFLIPDLNYITSGNDPFATLGLSSRTGLVTRYTLQSVKTVSTTGTIPLYDFRPITGALLDQPASFEKTILTGTTLRTGTITSNLDLQVNKTLTYRSDYLYYLEERIP